MNKELILKIADQIEFGEKLGLNMDSYISRCRTTACIAGHALWLADRDAFIQESRFGNMSVHNVAQNLMDLSDIEGMDLFYFFPKEAICDKNIVANVLRHFVKTGKVDWDYRAPIEEVLMEETKGSIEVQEFMKELEPAE